MIQNFAFFLSFYLMFVNLLHADHDAGKTALQQNVKSLGGGRSIQRSPSMSRVARPNTAARPQFNSPTVSRGNGGGLSVGNTRVNTTGQSIGNTRVNAPIHSVGNTRGNTWGGSSQSVRANTWGGSSQNARVNTWGGGVGSPRVGGQSNARNQIQDFIRNNPSVKLPNQTTSINGGIKNSGHQVKQNPQVNLVGKSVRNNVSINYQNRQNWFNRNFWDNHGYHPPYYGSEGNWWRVATAAGVGSWLGYRNQPYYYSYDNGYFGPSDYYAPAQTVYVQQNEVVDATQAATAVDGWLPLGVFAVSKNSQSVVSPNMFIQLALNKEGYISGSYYNTTTNEVYELTGGIDEDSQRAFWKIADNPGSPFVETGLYNLTEDEAPIRIYFSNGVVQDMLLVRINAS